MKDSGIEWIGVIPFEWTLKKNKEIFYEVKDTADAQTDLELLSVSEYYGVAKRKDVISSEETLMRADSLEGYKICNENDLVINIMLAWKGALGISPFSGLVSPAYNVFRRKSNAFIPKYYQYLFQTAMYTTYFKRFSTGIVDSRLRLYPNVFLSLTSHYPETYEQKIIADYLDQKVACIDNIIEKTILSIEEYQKLKQSIITEIVTKGLNPDVKMKDSGTEWIGQIPEHWEVLPIKNLFEFNKGLSITKEDLTDDGVSVISYGQIHSKDNKSYKINPDLIRFIPNSHPQISQNERVKPGDFVFADTSEDLIGTGNFILNDGMESLYSGYHTILLKPKSENQVLSKYLSFLFLSESWRAQIRSRVSGIKLFSLTQRIFKSSMIITPPADEQKLIASYLENKLNLIEKLMLIKESEVQELEQYKKSLIYEVVTGKKEINGKEVN